MKKIKFVGLMSMIVTMIIVMTCGMVGCDESKDIQSFYDTVVSSQEKLDIIADDIYQNWYDAIYNNNFSKDINIAIASALSDNQENLDFIETNEVEIQNLYKKVKDTKDSDLSSQIRDVMSAYSDYYEFVVNVSGSFSSYKESKETLKKELASALRKLKLEL